MTYVLYIDSLAWILRPQISIAFTLDQRYFRMTDHERSTTLRDAGRILFRHKRKALAFMVMVVSLVTLVTLLTPKVYRSQGKLLVKLGRENVGIDPTVTLGQSSTVSPPLSREDEINSLVEILRSRAVIEGVVKTLTPETILANKSSSSSRTPHEQAVLLLQEDLGVGAASKSNVLDVSFDHEDKELSRRVVHETVHVNNAHQNVAANTLKHRVS